MTGYEQRPNPRNSRDFDQDSGTSSYYQPVQHVVPVSPSQDYRRNGQYQTQMSNFVPATQGTSSPYSRNSGNYQGRGGSSHGKTIAVVVVVLALIAAVAGLGFYVYKQTQKDAINADLHKLSEEEMAALDSQLSGSTTFDEPFTILLLGSDERDDDPTMGARTDTNIIVRVDPTTNTLSMLSIPRDTYIDLPGVGATKFNSAYYYGGPSGTIAAAQQLTGIKIDHYAQINFEGLVDLIDAIGGIDVYVEERIDDPDAGPYVIEAGQQHLDGILSLELSRSRAYADGDFTRQKNQRKVIEAIIHKGLEAPASELAGLIQASTKFLTTDSALDFDFIYSLADQIRHNNDYPVTLYSANIPAVADMIGDVSYVIADTAGTAEMVKIFMEGGDISQPITASSISTDLANAGAGGNGGAIQTDVNNGYYYEEPTYVQEPVYTQEPVYAEEPTYYEETPQEAYVEQPAMVEQSEGE